MTVRIGVAEQPAAEDLDERFSNADQAFYEAQAPGRDSVRHSRHARRSIRPPTSPTTLPQLSLPESDRIIDARLNNRP